MFEVGDSFLDDNLYLVHADSLPKLPNHTNYSLICIGHHLSAAWSASGIPILFIRDVESMAAIMNEIHEIYKRYDT